MHGAYQAKCKVLVRSFHYLIVRLPYQLDNQDLAFGIHL